LVEEGYYQQRNVYGVLQMVGDVGGLNDAVIIAFQFIANFVSTKALYVNLVSKLFLVNKYDYQAKFKRKPQDQYRVPIYEKILNQISKEPS
jgi:hypothetical protein